MGPPCSQTWPKSFWFIRGNRLHRRVLLVLPGAAATIATNTANNPANIEAFYANNDVSAHLVGGLTSGKVVPNSLADLTKRENRFAHNSSTWPFDIRGWGSYGVPTLAECSDSNFMGGWVNGATPPPVAGPNGNVDMWDNSAAGTVNTTLSDQALPNGVANSNATRLADDVILNNVIEFDVKAWDKDANGGLGAYVDLGYGGGGTVALTSYPGADRFSSAGVTQSGLTQIYDSGNFSYENEGKYSLNASGAPTGATLAGQYTNGFDDLATGIVDNYSEQINPPPYPTALRGIQVKIRCFEPNSRQFKEVTIEHDFLPK